MAKIGQIYYKVPDPMNNSYVSNTSDLYSNIVSDNIKIIKLGIQAPSGTKVIIDDRTIMIGRSGLYELDIENLAIEKIQFVKPVKYKKDDVGSTTKRITGIIQMLAALYFRQWKIDKITELRAKSFTDNQYSSDLKGLNATETDFDDETKEIIENKKEGIRNDIKLDLGLQKGDSLDSVYEQLITDQFNEDERNLITFLQGITYDLAISSNFQETYGKIQTDFLSSYSLGKNNYDTGVNGQYSVEGETDLENVIVDYLYENKNS